jgi:hypothetical protein
MMILKININLVDNSSGPSSAMKKSDFVIGSLDRFKCRQLRFWNGGVYMNYTNYSKYRRILNLTLVILSMVLTILKIVEVVKNF